MPSIALKSKAKFMNMGITELLLILAIIFVIFGAGKLPNVMGDIGRAIQQFKKNVKEDDTSPKKDDEKL